MGIFIHMKEKVCAHRTCYVCYKIKKTSRELSTPQGQGVAMKKTTPETAGFLQMSQFLSTPLAV